MLQQQAIYSSFTASPCRYKDTANTFADEWLMCVFWSGNLRISHAKFLFIRNSRI